MTIAGSDPSGGAGIQADLKTFAAHRVYGVSVITAITAQSTVKIADILEIPINTIKQQMDTLLSDIHVNAIKTGMLVSGEIIECVAKRIKREKVPIVVDPILKAGTGRNLLKFSAIEGLKTILFPIADLITPNIYEAEKISEIKIKSEEDLLTAAEKIIKEGLKGVLIKGGHLESDKVVDFLLLEDGTQKKFIKERGAKQDRHGSGCVLSASITANIALGYDLYESVERAEQYLEKIYQDILKIGSGTPPINPFYGIL